MALPNRLCVFDLETTGVDVTTDKIVTAACLNIDRATGAQNLYTWISDPGVEISPEAAAVHGISTEYAREHGQDHDQVVREIMQHLYNAWDDGAAVVVYNAAFDLSMLHVVSGGEFSPTGPVLDPFVIDKGADKYRKGKRRLENLCDHYGVDFDPEEAHAADYDCLKTAEVLMAMFDGRRFDTEQPDDDLRELWRQQVRWKQEQHDSLASWLEKQGKTIDGDGRWPIMQCALDAV